MTQTLTLREARSQRRNPLTQEQLAERSGIDQTFISLLERGLRRPSDDTKKKLARALRISPDDLRFEDAVVADEPASAVAL